MFGKKTVGYVFGYGSLAHPDDWALRGAEPVYGVLLGWRRTWDVAIDNMAPLYDTKHYLYQGKRAECAVATLGIYRSDDDSLCNGVAIPVTKKTLELLDQRERSYQRSQDISSFFSHSLPGPLWTFLPSEEMKATFARGNVFVPRDYREGCREAFGHWSPSGWGLFLRSTDRLRCPPRDFQLWRAEGRQGL